MKVRCIDSRGVQYLTKGKEYLVLNTESSDEYFYVQNDVQNELRYYRWRFKIVEEPKKEIRSGTVRVEMEINRAWTIENPDLAMERVAEFYATYPADEWEVSKKKNTADYLYVFIAKRRS